MVLGKLFLTGVILVAMIPGLVVEPGPVTEVVGIGAILTVWGIDWNPDGA